MPADPEFENLVALYYRDLFRFAYSLARNESEAADFTQQTFYLWARKGHQLREAGQVKSWLFTTLHREFLQVRRRQRRFPELDLEAAAGELPEIAPESVARLDARTVLEFLGRIEAHQQAPLILYYLEDFSYKEIAAVLGIPLGTVQSRIARGKAQLYQLLNRSATAGEPDEEGTHG
jgi:RNA polymerase sigma-70 factor (ECF subfamily)